MSAEDRFNELVGALDFPMLIVTVAAGDRRAGCLVGFAAQASMDPPRYMVWLSKTNLTYEVSQATDTVAVHFPTADDKPLAELFGTDTGRDVDKFAHTDWHPGPNGVPILTACAQWFVGNVTSRHDTGDHEALLLDIVDAGAAHGLSQLSFQQVKNLPPGNDA